MSSRDACDAATARVGNRLGGMGAGCSRCVCSDGSYRRAAYRLLAKARPVAMCGLGRCAQPRGGQSWACQLAQPGRLRRRRPALNRSN